MAKYSEKTQSQVKKTMDKMKKGELKSGKGGKGGTVKNQKQAIAIALSESRKKGYKAPKAPSNGKSKKSKS